MVRTWTIEIRISEHEEEEPVRASLAERARGSDEERDTARSVADLAGRLLELTRDDVGQFTHGPGRLLI